MKLKMRVSYLYGFTINEDIKLVVEHLRSAEDCM